MDGVLVVSTEVPKLSVICACKDAEDTVHSTLKSLSLQSSDEIEYIFVDDGSRDRTIEIIESYSNRIDRLSIIRNAINIGPGASRNNAIREASGLYVGFIDADDWVHSDYYGRLIETIDKLGVDFVRCGYVEDRNKQRKHREAPYPAIESSAHPLDGISPVDEQTMVDYPWLWAGIYRLDKIRDHALFYDESLQTAEDRLLTWRLHYELESFAVSPNCGYVYRRGNASALTEIGDDRQLHIFKALRNIVAYLEARGAGDMHMAKAYRQIFAMCDFHYAKRERFDLTRKLQLIDVMSGLLSDIPKDIYPLALQGVDSRRRQRLERLRHGTMPV